MRPVVLPAMLLAATLAHAQEDPYLWLEEVEGDKALTWVREQNAIAEAKLGGPETEALEQRLRSILDSNEQIPYVSERNGLWYNLWRDAEHPLGLWRRTTPASFRTDNPEWDVLLDLDKLSDAEDTRWVWGGSDCLAPDYNKCLVKLSRGGSDAVVVREFDLLTKTFVAGGFELPEAKSDVTWRDEDSLYVGTDFGEGSLTSSGYPRIVKLWRRGTPLSEATVVFEGQVSDVASVGYRDHTPGFVRDFVYRSMTFYTNEIYLRKGSKLVKIEKPDHANASVYRDWLLLELREDWAVDGQTYPAGSLLASNFNKWLKGKREIQVLFTPTATTSLASFTATRNHIVLTLLDDVRSKVEVLTLGKTGVERAPLAGLPDFGALSVSPLDPDKSDALFVMSSDYLHPSSLGYTEVGSGKLEVLKALPDFFKTEGLEISQHFAASKDGTKIPYFQVSKAGLPADGSTPTLLYGYGGFEVSLLPNYSATIGAAWLEKGGAYAVANIRGGGEYGPRWHQAALKQHRHLAYEDFAAVASDLVTRGVTTQSRLGALGASNGGLLMGNMMVQYPEHFGAIVCRVPLLDMKRYHKLLAGASWMGEYGDPEKPEEWAFIETFSPYQLANDTIPVPPSLITTSTRDDRVHPGHARKMAAKLLSYGKPILYLENIEGGHGGAADNQQRAHVDAIVWQFLWQTLNAPPAEATAEVPTDAAPPAKTK